MFVRWAVRPSEHWSARRALCRADASTPLFRANVEVDLGACDRAPDLACRTARHRDRRNDAGVPHGSPGDRWRGEPRAPEAIA